MTALSFVGASGYGNNATATAPATNARALTAGNHHYVFVGWWASVASPTVTDTAGNTYTAVSALVQHSGSAHHRGQWFRCHSVAGHASNVVTATFPTAVSYALIRAIELSGDAPTVSQRAAETVSTSAAAQTDGFDFGSGSAVLSGAYFANSISAVTFSEVDNVASATWVAPVTFYSYGNAGYALYASGRAGLGARAAPNAGNSALLLSLGLALGTAPAADTRARVSQVVAEVIRSNDAAAVRASQVVAEVLRINTGTTISSSQVVAEVLRPNADAAAAAATRRRRLVIAMDT
jgi:hypothetical protein